jgi:hypothetical protein
MAMTFGLISPHLLFESLLGDANMKTARTFHAQQRR